MQSHNQIIKNCVRELKKYHGLPPHDGDNKTEKLNACFYRSIRDTFTVAVMRRANKRIQILIARWEKIRQEFIQKT
jgi:hypothetical protein